MDSDPPLWIKEYARRAIEAHISRGFFVDMGQKQLIEFINENLEHGCNYCGCELKYIDTNSSKIKPWDIDPHCISLDIINPKNRSLNRKNIQLLCHECNLTKGHHNHQEHIKYCRDLAVRFGEEWG